MVLESIVSPFAAKKRAWKLVLVGVLYSTVGLFLSYWVFKQYSSMIMVFLITMAAVPLLYHAMKQEEIIDIKKSDSLVVFREHSKVMLFVMMLFIGTTIGMTFWYLVLPKSMISTIFMSQRQTIITVNNAILGDAIGSGVFFNIFMNNVRVLLFCVLFSFLYGAGAIFILTWNSSVIATAIGSVIRQQAASNGSTVLSYAAGIFAGLMRYSLHGIPEILAYVIGGLAGSIISFAVIRHDFTGYKREKILFDSSGLILLAIGVLIIAGLLEIYVTPFLF